MTPRAAPRVRVRVDIVFPDVIRVRAGPAREFRRARPELLLASRECPAAAFRLRRGRDGLLIETRSLQVALRDDPLGLSFLRCGEAVAETWGRGLALREQQPAFGRDERAWRRPIPYGSARRFLAFRRFARDRFFGFGERYNFVEGSRRVITMWVDHNFRNPLMPDFVERRHMAREESTYVPVPLLLNTRGYGLFLNTTWKSTWRIGTEDENEWSLETDDPLLDCFLIYGPELKRILSRYTELTGRAPLPLRWAFGYWQSKDTYASAAEVLAVARKLRRRRAPCDVINIDWLWTRGHCDFQWRESFPDPAGMLRKLRAQHFKSCIWEGSFYELPHCDPAEPLRRGYLVPFQEGYYLDFTNPAAAAWWQDIQRRLMDTGIDTFKTDFGELVPEEARFANGRRGAEMHNAYPLLYRRAVFEVVRERAGQGLIFGRAGYAGAQRYPAVWAGDQNSTWEDLAAVVRAGLSIGLSGFPFWTSDIGGYVGNPPPELFVRWMQFGLFCPLAQAHGARYGREPWAYGRRAERIIMRYLRLRYRLMPYLYSAAYAASRTGLPMMRALALDFQQDPETHAIADQYLLGDALLVAPVLRPADGRTLYLPEGRWVDYWTGALHEGRQWIAVKAPLERLPLFVRSGSILPYGPPVEYLDRANERVESLAVYPEKRGGCRLYLRGRLWPIRYRYDGRRLHLSADPRLGIRRVTVHGTHRRPRELILE